jgi:Uma2 family endonuclease
MSSVKVRRGRSVVLYGIDWPTYRRIGRALRDRPALRLTYDRGVLEIMTTSPQHERFKALLRRLIETWTEERCVAISSFGSMTFRQPRRRALEPDECYWIANQARVHGKDHIDLRVDPPPDLVLEIDIFSSSQDRMALYGQMGVPEVWRFDGQALTFLQRQADGSYAEIPRSLNLPPLTPADVVGFLALRTTCDDNEIARRFRAWARQQPPAPSAIP